MDCSCPNGKCFYRKDVFADANKIVPLSCDCFIQPLTHQRTLTLGNKVVFVCQGKLRTHIFNNDMTNLVCESTISSNVNNEFVFEKMDEDRFVCYHPRRNHITIYSASTGQTLLDSSFSYNIRDIKYGLGLLIVQGKTQIYNLSLYSVENQGDELKVTGFIDRSYGKFFGVVHENRMLCQIIEDGFFVTWLLHDQTLVLWKINDVKSDYFNIDHFQFPKNYDRSEAIELLYSSDGYLICVFDTFIDLFNIKPNKFNHIKKVSSIMKSSSVKTVCMIPVHQFCVLTVQYVKPRPNRIQKPGLCGNAYITFHNLLNNKKYTVINLELFQCNQDFELLHCFYIFKNSTFLFLGAKSFKVTLKARDVDIVYHDIRMCARVLAQAYRTQTSMFCKLPLELTLAIICRTRSNKNNDYNVMRTVALRYLK